jgi:hypothetical protein
LLWPIDAKLGVWIGYIKSPLGIDCHPGDVLKVIVIVSKNRNSISAQLLEFALAY